MSRFLLLTLAILATGLRSEAGTGILELDSKPGGAEVFVDGKKKGTTPETEGQKLTMELPEGDHEIEIKKEGVGTAKKKIFVGEGVIQPLTLTIAAQPFTNSLGMKFVPVPGTKILMCVHETRNKDYAAYAAENKGVDASWKNPTFELSKKKYTISDDANHPVVYVSWDDAKAFCAWLSQKEGKTCRLPSDHEWSVAVGIGDQENEKESPKDKNGEIPGIFPWWAGYPPTKNNVGNYWDSTAVKKGATDSTDLGSYSDCHLLTAPVMSFQENKLGIFDLGGNVWEWCEDWYDPTSKKYRVLRGGSWFDGRRVYLASSYRRYDAPDFRRLYYGFRCVVVSGGGSSPP